MLLNAGQYGTTKYMKEEYALYDRKVVVRGFVFLFPQVGALQVQVIYGDTSAHIQVKSPIPVRCVEKASRGLRFSVGTKTSTTNLSQESAPVETGNGLIIQTNPTVSSSDNCLTTKKLGPTF